MAKKVIDLSKFNPVDDWLKVKAAVDAVVLRLGYRGAHTGTITYDPKYLEYMTACQKHGIPTMIYFFPCSITVAEAEAEANFIISAAKKVKLAGPIWLDSEVVYQDRSGRSDNLGKADRTKYLNVILRRLHEAGYECGVYASKSWFAGNLNDSGLEPYCLRWVAQWADQLTYSGHDVALWQYTNNGTIPGINGRVDISKCYIALDSSKGSEAVSSGVTRTDIVQQVCSWEGWNEKNEKHRIIIDIYNKYLPMAVKTGTLNYTVKYIDEWCATGASAAYIQAGAPELFPIECGCPRNIELAKKMGIWVEADNHIPKPADAVLYDWQDSGSGDNTGTADHIGIVIDVDEKAGTFVVMECNKDEAVGRRVMRINGKYIRGFICPKFAEDTNVPTKAVAAKAAADTPAKKTGGYEISGTGTPSKKVLFTGILMNGMQVTARRQPKVSGTPCSFSTVKGLTRISVCDYITTDKKWAYCCVGGLYGYILESSIRGYVRQGGQKAEKVAQWVLDDNFSTGEKRRKALEFLGYDYDAIQKIVTAKVQEQQKKESAENPRIRIWAIPPFFEGSQGERLFGDSTAIIQYDANDKPQYVVLIDAGLVKDNGKLKPPIVSKLKAAGITKIDALILSHAHGDHYAMFSDIFNSFKVEHLYLPKYDGLKALGLTKYVDAIKNQAKKAERYSAGYTYMEPGKEVFRIGQIVCECLFQANYKELANKDGHYAVNSLSPALRFTLGGTWRYHTAGDMQNDANRLMVKAVKDLRADVFKFQWHGDGNAISASLMEAMRPLVAFSNYHHKERSGRGGTRKKAEAVGAVVARNWENGDIYLDCQGETMKLSCSKGNFSRTFVKKN